ncbi:MAG TPA: TerB family tellurite resistance protein [Deltaproteobacteria bacterium]|nr:TerB family tellurite resistance protein [Deltaproteobacteria bacterium]
MDLKDLTEAERRSFFGLLTTMVDADGKVAEEELEEIDALAEEMEIDLCAALEEARAQFRDRDAALESASEIQRTEARELVQTVLHDLAQRDGEQSPEELQLLADLRALWSDGA